MADRLSSSPRSRPAPGSAADEARVEQLLVTGLDHYFAGEYDAAINAWTRVLFLDRHHDRARAYIERARSAQAEHLRASEALVHEGLAAFDRGEVARARELLSTAMARGVSHDIALGVLGRIDRLDVPGARPAGSAPLPGAAAPEPLRRSRRRMPGEARPGSGPRPRLWWAAAAILLGLGVAAAVWSTAPGTPMPWAAAAPERPAGPVMPAAALPVPAPAEAYVTTARALFASGHLRDSLRWLDRVPVGSPLGTEADRLRAQIQQELLTATAIDTAPPAPATALPRE